MDKFFEALFGGIQKNLKNPKLYAAIAVFIFLCALVFPYVDANYFSYNRIEKRISILENISQLDPEKIAQTPSLQEEYDAILSEIDQQRKWSVSNADRGSSHNADAEVIPLFKFISGGVLSWFIALLIPFMNTFKDKRGKIAAFFLLLIVGCALGGIGYFIPTFFNPWFNYIGWPILQIVFVAGLAIKPKGTT